jgi:spore coat protein U-like protein
MGGFVKKSASAAALSVLLAASGARAVTCTIDATSSVAFGTYNIGAANDSLGTITYTCHGNPGAVVSLGTGGSGSYSPRRMTAGGPDVLTYNLYTTAARTQVWGDGTGGTVTVSVAPGNSVVLNVYGRIPALQGVTPGSYTDSVVVTFTF